MQWMMSSSIPPSQCLNSGFIPSTMLPMIEDAIPERSGRSRCRSLTYSSKSKEFGSSRQNSRVNIKLLRRSEHRAEVTHRTIEYKENRISIAAFSSARLFLAPADQCKVPCNGVSLSSHNHADCEIYRNKLRQIYTNYASIIDR